MLTLSAFCGIEKMGGEKNLDEKVASAMIAFGVSVVANKILAIHTFKVIDGYVKGLLEITKESIRNAYSGKRTS